LSEYAIEVDGLWKKFQRGELHDSLRDLIPHMAKRLVGRGPSAQELAKNQFWALKDVTFRLQKGEALGIIGPNGAGKSTLLKVLSRILRPTRGSYAVRGQLSALIEVAAGFHPDLTGRENIYLNGAILGMRKREVDQKLDDIIEFSGISDFIDTPVKRYSSGMQARLGFSVIAHIDPEILLIDEVLSVGDAAFRQRCMDHMVGLMQRLNVSVIFISHRLDDVRQVCDRCLVLHRGEIVFGGDVDEACRRYFDCFREVPPIRGSEDNATSGRLVGLRLLDDRGRPCEMARSHEPVTLEISFTLTEAVGHLGLRVNFHRADGRLLTHCQIMGDRDVLPCTPGDHRVHLALKGLPFPGGDYLVGLRLFDLSSDTTLDRHDRQYPLQVAGEGDYRYSVHLSHSWSVPSRSESTGESGRSKRVTA